MSKGREYTVIWIYVPTKISSDSAFPFRIGDPCFIAIDTKHKQLTIRNISMEEAVRLGWKRRERRVVGREEPPE